MKAVSNNKKWDLDYGNIALMWRGGCIIRSVFLDKIKEAFNKRPDLTNLMLDPYFKNEILDGVESLRKVCAVSMLNGIAVPSLAAALTYFDGYRSEKLPANLLQAQRDYFGAHTYERTDFPKGKSFHTNWK
jgi:6-phosphogluconate dehydrogenase